MKPRLLDLFCGAISKSFFQLTDARQKHTYSVGVLVMANRGGDIGLGLRGL